MDEDKLWLFTLAKNGVCIRNFCEGEHCEVFAQCSPNLFLNLTEINYHYIMLRKEALKIFIDKYGEEGIFDVLL